MKALLADISGILWLLELLSLFAFAYIAKKNMAVNSSLITLFIVYAVGSLMGGYEAYLDAYIDAHPGYNAWVSFFGTWGLLHFIFYQ
jgi:hypothetical protein